MSRIPATVIELIDRYARIASGGDADIADELADHLVCEVSNAIDAGAEPLKAFLEVSTHFGHPAEIAEAFAEQRTANHQNLWRQTMSLNQRTALMLGHSLVWAATILATSAVVADTGEGKQVMLVLLAGWAATFFPLQSMIGGGRAAACAEWAWMKRTARRILPGANSR